MKSIYLYNNSKAQGKQGFIIKKNKSKHSVETSVEYAFAKEFNTLAKAVAWRNKYGLVAIILERV